MPNTFFFIGARAAGKTTIGGLLAEKLGLDFIDTDIHLQEISSLTVAEIVSSEGWPGFRRRESEILRAVTRPNVVIATGGGMVLAAENRAFMRASGTALFLNAPPEVLAGRLMNNPNEAQRPTLTGKSIVEEMAEIVAQRDALYREAAHHVLDAAQSIASVLEQALEAIGSPLAAGK